MVCLVLSILNGDLEIVILEMVIWHLNDDFEMNQFWVWKFEFSFEIDVQIMWDKWLIWNDHLKTIILKWPFEMDNETNRS